MAATVQLHCESLAQALSAYAPKVTPSVICGGKQLSLQELCSSEASQLELHSIYKEIRASVSLSQANIFLLSSALLDTDRSFRFTTHR